MNNQLSTMEERFLQLISGIDIENPVMDFDRYGNKLFWFDKDGKWICEYNLENERFWLNYRIWSVLKNEYSLNYNDIHAFMKTMVETHFKLKGVTPWCLASTLPTGVETHFKLKGVTPTTTEIL